MLSPDITPQQLEAALAALISAGYEVIFAESETDPGHIDAFVLHNSDTTVGTASNPAAALSEAWPEDVELPQCGAEAPPELAGYRCRLPIDHGGDEHKAAGCSWWVNPAAHAAQVAIAVTSDGCYTQGPGGYLCTHHGGGWHLALGPEDEVCAAWPIEPEGDGGEDDDAVPSGSVTR